MFLFEQISFFYLISFDYKSEHALSRNIGDTIVDRTLSLTGPGLSERGLPVRIQQHVRGLRAPRLHLLPDLERAGAGSGAGASGGAEFIEGASGHAGVPDAENTGRQRQ